ncbi:cell division protein ZapA [Polymorphobacter fuscus]|uniref:Cell division protein ZapA n=1 Tax=Sandarakinorhabdus fusca TaxID=1439888 RepID=A0A7C9GNI9_9SPHN|nr:cell division protein ZapA [Polymorphobacter fuscus]KAB7648745.1 cell division protein ZapA [Polymorphobacter fuscus]MQT16313.1 cell division protein ZapA [Polymorphobacter fuscus]NJC07400.1 cell division protein ZapA [Polymorphobacter fuscus]
MGQVNVQIGGRGYPLSCRDGDEPHLAALAADIAAKADRLTGQLGQMSESRLLLMTALMIADELHEARKGHFGTAPADPRLAALVARAEALADALQG